MVEASKINAVVGEINSAAHENEKPKQTNNKTGQNIYLFTECRKARRIAMDSARKIVALRLLPGIVAV